MKTTACSALGEMGRNGPLPLDAGKDESEANTSENSAGQNGKEESASPDEKKQKKEEKANEQNVTKLSLVNTLIAMIKTSNEANKVKLLTL